MPKTPFAKIIVTLNADMDGNDESLDALSDAAEELQDYMEVYLLALVRDKYPQFTVSVSD